MKTLFNSLLFFSLLVIGCKPSSGSDEQAAGQVSAAPTAAPIGADIMYKHWKLIEIDGKTVTNPPAGQKEAYISMFDSNKLMGNSSCNQLLGNYEISEGNRIRFYGVGSTMMACPDGTIEMELGRELSNMDNYSLNGKFLTLQKAKMAPKFRFEATEQ